MAADIALIRTMNKDSMYVASALEKGKFSQEKNTLVAILFCFAFSYGLRYAFDVLERQNETTKNVVAYCFIY